MDGFSSYYNFKKLCVCIWSQSIMQLCRLKQLFIVFEINFNAKHSHVCWLPAEEVVFRNASVSYSTLLLVFWNTKIGGNASATAFGVSEHLAFRTVRCIQTPGVSKHQVFWDTRRFETPCDSKHQKWWQTRFHHF